MNDLHLWYNPGYTLSIDNLFAPQRCGSVAALAVRCNPLVRPAWV